MPTDPLQRSIELCDEAIAAAVAEAVAAERERWIAAIALIKLTDPESYNGPWGKTYWLGWTDALGGVLDAVERAAADVD